MGGKNSAACPSLAPVTLTVVRKATYSLGVQVVVVEGVWKPGDSLSPPDISPVRPLIRQQGRAGPTSPVGSAVSRRGRAWSACESQPTNQIFPILGSAPPAPPVPPWDPPSPAAESRDPSSALSTVVENTSFN